MPVADLFTRPGEEISKFREKPVRWKGDASDPAARREVAGRLHEFAKDVSGLCPRLNACGQSISK
jgi:hypothetical protein